MASNLLVFIIIFISLIIGVFFGIIFSKIRNKKIDKKIIKNAKEVLENKRKNTISIDGQEYDATLFRVRDENNKEILIDLKGGGSISNATTERKKPISAGAETNYINEKKEQYRGKKIRGSGENIRDIRKFFNGVRKS